MLLTSHNLGLLVDIPPPNGGPTFYDLIHAAYEADSFPSEVLQMQKDGVWSSEKVSMTECNHRDDRLCYCGKLHHPDYLPLHFHVLQQYQDTPKSGRSGQAKTFEIVTREPIWFGMPKDIARYIRNCHTC
jgi:hypothetical protein